MMKKLTMFLCLACAWMCSLQAQEAKTFFKNMPDSLSPLLTAVNRADCIDFLESKMKAEVTNRFGGKSEMTELAPYSDDTAKLLANEVAGYERQYESNLYRIYSLCPCL